MSVYLPKGVTNFVQVTINSERRRRPKRLQRRYENHIAIRIKVVYLGLIFNFRSNESKLFFRS